MFFIDVLLQLAQIISHHLVLLLIHQDLRLKGSDLTL